MALVDAISGAKDKKKITTNFLALLRKNGDEKKVRQIIALAEGLLLKKTGNRKVVLETARKTDTKSITKLFIEKGDIVQEKINPSLIAGIKITVDGSKQLDLSLKNKLDNIYARTYSR